MKAIIIGSIAMVGLTGCAQLTQPIDACTNVVYYNDENR